jgi:hypothetical protein
MLLAEVRASQAHSSVPDPAQNMRMVGRSRVWDPGRCSWLGDS